MALQGVYARSIGPIGGLGDPYGPIPAHYVGPLRGPMLRENRVRRAPIRGATKWAHMDPKGDPYMGPFCYLEVKNGYVMSLVQDREDRWIPANIYPLVAGN